MSEINEKLKKLVEQAGEHLANAKDSKMVEDLRVGFLGKKGELTQIMRSLGDVAQEERPKIGKLINDARETITQKFEETTQKIKETEYNLKIKCETIDVTIPGKQAQLGNIHPITKISTEIQNIFIGMGFEICEGPEVEWDKNNFELLNIPKDHPARDMQDTFYIDENKVLRTHTSPVQVRVMQTQKPPIRMIAPGRVYRADDVDATHSPIFNQIEGLVIDKNITMGDLKGVLHVFAKEVYGAKTEIRLRPSYFPFTEPSVEVDVSCAMCSGKGCKVCKETGWIEILGAGMVHPDVLKNNGIDPEIYSGFAFGFGIDRMANMKYGITDIRLLYENDLRFLSQFKY